MPWVWVVVALLMGPLIAVGNPAIALLTGTVLSLVWRRPLGIQGSVWGRRTLQTAIVLLGFSLSIGRVVALSGASLGLVAAYVLGVLAVGYALGRALRLESPTNILLTSGTAICGGTAIATLAPIVGARADQVGVAIGIVFLLNAAALFGFPVIGHALGLSQAEFGLWAALAVHDTSSVVATAAIYGQEALEVATTVKLGRTLWLIPLALAVALRFGQSAARVRVPTFILAFVAASVFATVVPLPQPALDIATRVSKGLLVAALFFIGTEIRAETLRRMRGRVLVHAVLLWLLAASVTLAAVIYGR